MQEEQIKNLQVGADLEGLDEELSVEELEGVAGGADDGSSQQVASLPRFGIQGGQKGGQSGGRRYRNTQNPVFATIPAPELRARD